MLSRVSIKTYWLLNEDVLVTSTFYQLASEDKRLFPDALKAVFLKTRTLSITDFCSVSILPAYAYGIFGQELSTVEFDNVQRAFLDNFWRWREVVLKVAHKIVVRFREIYSNQ